MRAAGVPLVPGTRGNRERPTTRARPPEELGYPVLLKAAAGGGGKGMRLVDGARRARTTPTSARPREATAAFGDGTLYVEKVITPARHVEIQVLCDAHGGVLTLRRARVLDPAPPPEADRGVAVAGARRRAPRGDGGRRRARVPAHRLPQRRHVRVPRRARRLVLLHRAQRAAAGRASGHGARSSGSTSSASRCGSRRASALAHGGRAARAAATRSRSGSTPRTRRAASLPRPAGSSASGRRSAPASASTRSSRRGP